MPRLHEMIDSKFLRKEDLASVGDEMIATINDFSLENVAMEDQPKQMKWCVSFKELGKPMVLNSTNLQLMAKIFGSDNSDDWLGKRIVVYVDPNVSYQGKLIGGLRVRALRRPAPPVPSAANRRPIDEMEDDVPF